MYITTLGDLIKDDLIENTLLFISHCCFFIFLYFQGSTPAHPSIKSCCWECHSQIDRAPVPQARETKMPLLAIPILARLAIESHC